MGELTATDKCLVIGALLYFLNPVDLIPGAIPGIGYIDDYAVMSLVLGAVATRLNAEEKKPVAKKIRYITCPKTQNGSEA